MVVAFSFRRVAPMRSALPQHPAFRHASGTMASADFSRLSAPSLARLPSSGRAVRPPQVNMASFAPSAAASIFRTSCRDGTSLFLASSSVLSDLECGFCTSARGFVSGFLQIPPREGHPCLRLAVPSAGPQGTCTPKNPNMFVWMNSPQMGRIRPCVLGTQGCRP